MADITFEEVLEMAEQLTAEERARLVKELQAKLTPPLDYGVTREQLLAEFERKKAAGAFDNLESLRGKYANPDVDISEEELRDYLHQIRTEWEAEMDEIIGDD